MNDALGEFSQLSAGQLWFLSALWFAILFSILEGIVRLLQWRRSEFKAEYRLLETYSDDGELWYRIEARRPFRSLVPRNWKYEMSTKSRPDADRSLQIKLSINQNRLHRPVILVGPTRSADAIKDLLTS